jgi:hypothetical protein
MKEVEPSTRRILLAAVAASVLAWPLTAAGQVRVVEQDEAITIAGTTVKRPPLSGPAPAGDAVPPEPPFARATPQQAEAALKQLFAAWPDAHTYAGYLLQIPIKLQLQESGTGANFAPASSPDGYLYKPYPGLESGIRIVVPATMKAPTNNEAFKDTKYALCVAVEQFGTNLPVPAAEELEAGFINGFVTRLFLQPRIETAIGGRAALDLPPPLQINLQFSAAATYTNAPDGGDPNAIEVTFSQRLRALLEADPLQPRGLLLGWKAAGSLGSNPEARKAAWNVVSLRFSPRQIGRIVGFTLNYVVGYARMRAIADPGQPLDQLLARIHSDETANQARSLLASVNEMIGAEEYAHTSLHGDTSEYRFFNKAKLAFSAATAYHYFVVGYHEGSVRAADEIFDGVFQLAYGIGYQQGFKAGYAKGYSDGFKAGQDQAWAVANQRIRQLEKELDDARSFGRFCNDVSNVVRTVGSVVQTVGQVIGAVLAFL